MRVTQKLILAFAALTAFTAAGQTVDVPQPRKPVVAPSYAWKLLSPLGLREDATIDTLFEDFSRRAVPSEISDAWACTGNFGAAGLNMIFDERPAMSDFYPRDAVMNWIPSSSKARFYNTRIPMTLLGYTFGGGKENSQDLLTATFSGNINARAQVGAMLDYLYSKGSYANQAAKALNWGFSGSYLGDRYEFQGYYYHYNLLDKENGGITDMLYIEDPAELQGGVSKIDSKAIPTRLSNAQNRVTGQQLYINNRYKVGYWQDVRDEETDTIKGRTYIPVTSFIHTLDLTTSKHIFMDHSPGETGKYFESTYLNPKMTHDKTGYLSVSNTLGVSMLEGFHKYAKFGLAAYATYQIRRYTMPEDTLDRTNIETLTPLPDGFNVPAHATTEHLAYVGAQLTKQRGSILRYEATAELGILGSVAGDLRLNGHLTTNIPLRGDSLVIKAFGQFSNEEAPFLTRHMLSNHFVWDNNFGKQRRLRLGGSLSFDRSGTDFTVSVSNLQNHIYFDASGMPVQNGGSVQVLSMSLQQNLHFRALHWDNRITYQKTGNDAVIPLPELTVYSNLYVLTRIATLKIQFGVDCDWYTRYYAPGWQPATMSFTNQREMKLGNYPFCNIYANMKLSKVRFYVMCSHFNQGLFGGSGYFSMPYYPLNPRRFQLGLSIDFAN